jgi:hypothetical protein
MANMDTKTGFRFPRAGMRFEPRQQGGAHLQVRRPDCIANSARWTWVSRHRAENYLQTLVCEKNSASTIAARYADRGVAPPEAKNPAKSSGCVSKQRSPSGSVIHGCLLPVQICAVGFSHEVSSNVPARTERNIPPNLGLPVSHEPQSRHIHRVDTRPLSPVLCARWGSPAVRRNASSVTTKPMEKALLVIF